MGNHSSMTAVLLEDAATGEWEVEMTRSVSVLIGHMRGAWEAPVW